MGRIIIFIFIFCLTYSVFAIESNETAVNKVVPLDETWEELGDAEYTDSITLSPYSSEILISTDIYAPQTGGSVKYLDINATDDTGDGSIGDPYKDIELTLIPGTSRLNPGDVLVIRGGTYPTTVKLSLPPSRSTLEERIVVQSYPNETVIIDGTNVAWARPSNDQWMEGVISLQGGRDYDVIDGIEVHNSQKIGIYVNNDYGKVLNCKTYHTGCSGIYITTANNVVIDNNEIELGTYLGDQEMITIYGSHDVIISNNHVHHGGNENSHINGLGIDVKNGGSNIEIVGNKIHDIWSHCIYVDSRGDTHNIRIHGNEVYNTQANGIQIATEVWTIGDPIANDIKIYNNLVYDVRSTGIRIGYSSRNYNYFYNLHVVNNTIYNIGNIGISYDLNSDANHTAHDVRISNNILRATGAINSEYPPIYKETTDPGVEVYVDTNIIDRNIGDVGDNAIVADPLFVNEAAADFRLKTGSTSSPALDAGIESTDIYNPDYDYLGTARPINSAIDIGAYESDDITVGSVTADAGSDVSICDGENTTLNASGGSNYSWSTGATTSSITVSPSSTQIYTVTVSDSNGNSDTDDVQVTVNSVTANAGSDLTIDEGDNTTLTASGGGSYLWNTGATTQSITVSPTSTTTYSVIVTNNGCDATDDVNVTVNPAGTVSADAGPDESICLGESVALTASGGSGYSWNTGATTKSITVNPNSTTTYSVTVTEGTESDTDQVVVTVNNVTANAGSDRTITEGGNTTLTASGGGSYLWNTGASTATITVSPIASTTYSVTVTNNGCEDTDDVNVTVNPAGTVSADAGPDESICLGENVTLTASGGSGYSWNTGATTPSITVNPNSTTTYSVTVTDGAESDTDDVVVTVNDVTANAGSDRTITEGETITLVATGGDTYLWSTGDKSESITVSPNSTRNYSVTAYNGACQDTDQLVVNVEPIVDSDPPPAQADAGEDMTICLGETIVLNGSGGETYQWNTGETSSTISVNPSRTVTYELTAIRGGVSNTDTVIITVENCENEIISDEEDLAILEMAVYPNPTKGKITILINNLDEDANFIINDNKGSLIYSDYISGQKTQFEKQINLSRYSDGLYFVRLYTAEQYLVKKVIVQ